MHSAGAASLKRGLPQSPHPTPGRIHCHSDRSGTAVHQKNITFLTFLYTHTHRDTHTLTIASLTHTERVPKYWINISHSHKYPAHAGYYHMRGTSLPHYFLMTILTLITSFVSVLSSHMSDPPIPRWLLPPIFY